MSSRLLRIRNGKRGKKIRRVCYDKSQGKIVLWRRDQLQLEDEESQMSGVIGVEGRLRDEAFALGLLWKFT